jgi:hypothetical protein
MRKLERDELVALLARENLPLQCENEECKKPWTWRPEREHLDNLRGIVGDTLLSEAARQCRSELHRLWDLFERDEITFFEMMEQSINAAREAVPRMTPQEIQLTDERIDYLHSMLCAAAAEKGISIPGNNPKKPN